MKRRLLNLLAVLSLLLFLAVVVLWVRSYWRYDNGMARNGRQVLLVYSVCGRLTVTWGTERDSRERLQWSSYRAADMGSFRCRALVTFGVFSERTGPGGETSRSLRMPHWAWATLAGVLPVAVLRRRRRSAARIRLRLCPSCGYDLRATPDRCPECGYTPAAANAERATSSTS